MIRASKINSTFFGSAVLALSFVFMFWAGDARADFKCAAVPGWTLSTFAFCTTTIVKVSGTSATIDSSTVRQDDGIIDQGLPPIRWEIASDIRVFIDGVYLSRCNSSTNTVRCTVDNLSAQSHQFQTNWIGTKSGQTMFTENYDGFSIGGTGIPSTPTMNAVSPNPSTAGQTINFSWSAPSGALFYFIKTDAGPCFAQGVCYSYTNSFSRSDFGAGNYSVRVKACTTEDCSSYSSPVSFTVNPLLLPPTISSFTATDGRQSGNNITVPVGTAITFNWSTSGATSCTTDGILGTFAVPINGPSQSLTVTIVGGPFTQNLTCSNASGNSSPSTVSVTVIGPPAKPTLSICTTPSTCTPKAAYTTDEAATISWAQPSQPAGTNYYIYVNGGAGIYAGCTIALGGCQTLLTGATGLIGSAFTVGTGRFVEVKACNSAGQCSAASDRLTFDVSVLAQNVTYTIQQAPIPGIGGQQTVFPMAISEIRPFSVQMTVPNQTSAQLTLYYHPDGSAPNQPITSGVSWFSNNSSEIAVNSNGLVTTSLQAGGGDCVPGTPNCVFFPARELGRATITAIYQGKIAMGEVIVWGSIYSFVPPQGEGGNN